MIWQSFCEDQVNRRRESYNDTIVDKHTRILSLTANKQTPRRTQGTDCEKYFTYVVWNGLKYFHKPARAKGITLWLV